MKVVARMLDLSSHSVGFESCQSRTVEQLNPSLTMYRLVRSRPMVETLLRCSVKLTQRVQVNFCLKKKEIGLMVR